MKHFLIMSAVFMLFFSCDNKNQTQKPKGSSSGALNNISIVIDNESWDGAVGEAIRDLLAAPIYGLPQPEPMYTMNNIPTHVFSGFVRKNRTILIVEKGKEADVKIGKDAYARPQKVVVVSGKTDEEIIKQIKDNGNKIVNAFKTEEIKEKQRQISKSLYKDDSLRAKLNLSLKFPSAYRIAKQEDNFFWIRRDITTGHNNLLIYSLPFDAIQKNDSLVSQIVRLRDSIGKKHIRGRLDGHVSAKGEVNDSYMITEKAYAPFIYETIIDNKSTLETKGIWDLKGDFMSGPFINYIIEDEINDRLIVIEGFVLAPSVNKRNYVFELEAIIKSLKIQ